MVGRGIRNTLFPEAPPELKQRFEEERLETNIGRMLGFAWYIIALQILLQVLNIAFPQLPGQGMKIPMDAYIVLSLVTLALGVVYVILFTFAKKGRIKSFRVKRGLVISIITLYAAIQMTFNTFNVLTIQGVYGMMTLSLLIGLIPIIPLKKSGAVILAALVYTLVLMYATRDITDQDGLSSWDHFAQTDMRANLIIMVGLAAFVSAIVYNLYVRNFLKSAELEGANDRLEEQVRERTRELEEQTIAAQTAYQVKSRFLSGMNHELRTPLNAIVGMASIARNAPEKEKSEEAFIEIEQQSARLIAILNDMSEIIADERRLTPEEPSGVPDLTGRHILIVDDVEINRTVLAGLIECTEAEVRDAKDGNEAVEKFAASPEGYYDFIFMDIMMPKMDGNDATRRIREMGRADSTTVPIIAISANALKSDVESALAAGMNTHIAKPVDFDTIMRVLREFLA
jgi:CheY-like chemotaxis protein